MERFKQFVESNTQGWSFIVTTKKYGKHEVTVSRSNAKSKEDAEQHIKNKPMYKKYKPTKIEYVKEEANLDEGYKASSQKSTFGGHRAHLKNPEGKTSYMGSASYKKPEHAKGEAQAYHDAYFGGPSKANERSADRAVAAYRAKHKDKMHVKESVDLDEAKQIDEISRSMKPMNKSFGKTVDPKKFDAYKKHMKKHS